MTMFSKPRQDVIVAEAELSEAVLDHVVGGFNPQPDPPGVVANQTRLNPSDFGIRARQIAG